MSSSNFLHRFAERLKQLNEENARLANSQCALRHRYASLLAEMGTAAQQDPQFFVNLQAELSGAAQLPASLPVAFLPPPPHAAPVDDTFFSFDEDQLVAFPSHGLQLGDTSPPFAPTGDKAATEQYFLPALDDIPFFTEFPGPALVVPDAVISPAALDLVPHIPASNSSGDASSFMGSPFSSTACSPFFSPLDAALNAPGSWASPSSVPYHSLNGTCSSFSSFSSGAASLPIPGAVQQQQPPTSVLAAPLFGSLESMGEQGISPASFEAQLNEIMASSVFAAAASQPFPPVVEQPSLARVPSQACKARSYREASFDNGVRFSPMAAPTEGRHLRQASVVSCASSLLASPEIKPLVARSSLKKTRTARTIKEDPSMVVVKNIEHMFASKNKVEASDSPVTRLFLDEATVDPSSPLGRSFLFNEPYSPASFRLDCTLGSVYTFYTASRTAWVVSFSLSGPSISPSSSTDLKPAKSTFLHFLPGDVVVAPSEPIGSIAWWRLQECRGSHANYPGEGAWTARFDGAGQEATRRPARIFSHFAKCVGKGCEESGDWSLMKLAKAMKGGK
ncbi:hypothetical protein JCM8547_004576 [Rhodosporidiobolus lusitaniae]